MHTTIYCITLMVGSSFARSALMLLPLMKTIPSLIASTQRPHMVTGSRPNLICLTSCLSMVQITALIRQYWCVFDYHCKFVPVCHYQCVINTESAAPIAVKKIQYGLQEILIIRKSIAALERMGRIRQIHDGQWLFKALLTPKPHQKQVQNIKDMVW
jgi:hypothetical protein